jgi:putative transposase
VLTKPTTTLSVLLNTDARYSWAQLGLGWRGLLKIIAERHGYVLLAARVHDGDHMHLFVSAPPKVCVPEMVRVFKCVSAKTLFDEFPMIRKQLWGGHLWSEGYAIRTAGVVTSAKIEEYINRT